MLMHETRIYENYDLKWSKPWPLFFRFFYRGKPEEPEKSLFLFYSFCLFFFSLLKKKEKREYEIKKKIGKRKTEKREEKKIPLFNRQQVSLFGFFRRRYFVFSTIRHRGFFFVLNSIFQR